MPETILVVNTYLPAFRIKGPCNLPVHKSIANARDGTNGCLHVTRSGKPAQNRHAPFPGSNLSPWELALSAEPRFAACESRQSPLLSSRHKVPPGCSLLSRSFLDFFTSQSTHFISSSNKKTATRHPSWLHHVCFSFVHVPRLKADRPQSKSAQSSPTCLRSSIP
jgi:hypothetical protein